MSSLALSSQPLLGPILGLCVWTLVMEIWMYAVRLPAYAKYKVNMSDPAKVNHELATKVPPKVFRAGENYNHLMEQPTQFYATVLVLNACGVNDRFTVTLAWLYVGLRIAHSLVQATFNNIPLRFRIFASSGIVLLALTGIAILAHNNL